MKKLIITLLIAGQVLSTPITAQAKIPATRTMSGTYYDYMTVLTRDGQEWMLSDFTGKRNRFMKWETVLINGKKRKRYVPRFKSGQKVRVKFDTTKTKTKKDDRIISIRKS